MRSYRYLRWSFSGEDNRQYFMRWRDAADALYPNSRLMRAETLWQTDKLTPLCNGAAL